MTTSAQDRWRLALEGWALPPDLLASAEASPYGWSADLWRRRSRQADMATRETHTVEVVRTRASGERILDIGAGRGRASMPLARNGGSVVMVEPDEVMLAGLREEIAESDVDVEVVSGRWPDVADRVGSVAVSMCAHVVYDVPDLGPFLEAMDRIADRAVVIEMTPRHPWSGLTPYYQVLHGLDRPDEPSADHLIDVVQEVLPEVTIEMEAWSRSGGLWFESMDELLAHFGRRLLVGSDRRRELADLLTPDVVESEGRFRLGPSEQFLVTVWWAPRSSAGS